MSKLKRSDFPVAFNDGFEPYRVRLRCRCGSRDLEITETIEAHTSWEVKSGLINHQGGIHEFGGAIGVRARCYRCRHEWTPRGVIQVTDLHHPVQIENDQEEPQP